MSKPETRAGKAAENWFRDFAKTYNILRNKQFPLEKVVKLLDEKLQFKLKQTRPYLPANFPFANEWIESILSRRGRATGNIDEKARLAAQLLDGAMATDVIINLRDNRGRDQVIAVDVTSNPKDEQSKLNTIRGQRDTRDVPGFNQNQSLPEARKDLGIDRHLIVVLNPKQPPEQEQLLGQIYAFANSSTRTRSINVWSPAQEVSKTRQQEAASTQTPHELWCKYNQEVTTNSDIKRQAAIAEKALKDGLAAKLPEILACDPFVQKVKREQGLQIARKHIQTVIRAVSTKLAASKQSQRSPKQEKRRDLEPEL